MTRKIHYILSACNYKIQNKPMSFDLCSLKCEPSLRLGYGRGSVFVYASILDSARRKNSHVPLCVGSPGRDTFPDGADSLGNIFAANSKNSKSRWDGARGVCERAAREMDRLSERGIGTGKRFICRVARGEQLQLFACEYRHVSDGDDTNDDIRGRLPRWRW